MTDAGGWRTIERPTLSSRYSPFNDDDDHDRFYSSVSLGSVPEHWPELGPCWVWTGSTWGGYGWYKGHLYAHRAVLEESIGRRLVPGEQALHRCDNPLCVRRSHLFTGTNLDNRLDSVVKGRTARGRWPEERRLAQIPVLEKARAQAQVNRATRYRRASFRAVCR